MEKSEKTINKIGRYLRQVSVVVIGVAITLLASYFINAKNEKRDMALYLNAIKLEIEDNIKLLEEAKKNLEPWCRYHEYLLAHEKNAIDKDTIESYSDIFYALPSGSFKTNAFEMFKNSGNMRLMNDKELLLALWDVYNNYSLLKEELDWAVKIKWGKIDSEQALLLEGGDICAPMYNFYISGIPQLMICYIEDALAASYEIMKKLDGRKI